MITYFLHTLDVHMVAYMSSYKLILMGKVINKDGSVTAENSGEGDHDFGNFQRGLRRMSLDCFRAWSFSLQP